MATEGHVPYLMPDGRRLGHYLSDSGLMRDDKRRGKKGSKGRKDRGTWETAAPRTAAAVAAVAARGSELEQVELQALDKVGARRRRRWLNDKLLRDMAGPLTAMDMESLFKPVPFGFTGYESALTQACAPQNAAVWSHFININPDKEKRVLQKWEAHIQEMSSHADRSDLPTYRALQSWSRVPRKLRSALKSAGPHPVAELEAQLLQMLDAEGEVSEVHLELGPFERLLGHGIAEFHGLVSISRDGADGSRELVVRRRAGQAYEACDITCADVLFVLDDREAASLSCRTLEQLLQERAHTSCDEVVVA